VLEIHACTATSTRLRGEANAYNRLTLVAGDLRLDSMAWNGNDFARAETAAYERIGAIWRRSTYVPAPALSGASNTTLR
jgi:hypothetical protein